MFARVSFATVMIIVLGSLPAFGEATKDVAPQSAKAESTKPVPDCAAHTRAIDLVICLDTSGSMTALIDSARGRIWDMVNELASAKPTPRLRVGLLTYGSPNLSTAEKGWVVLQSDLSDDLDAVYERMMGMVTNGGDEYVGWVLNDAIQTMSWSSEPDALRWIFVSGNESADQASERFNFRYVAEQARDKNIVVNAIYAGNWEQGINEKWNEIGGHTGGEYAAIDMQQGTLQIETPQDPELARLNEELNKTYVPYGKRGHEGQANQVAQDRNANGLGSQSCSSRVVTKGCGLYNNAWWDLVDASKQKGFRLADLKSDDLPEGMRPMTQSQRQAYVDGLKSARDTIQTKIQAASALRNAYLNEASSRATDGSKTALDDAVRGMIRRQAEDAGFTLAPTAPVAVAAVKKDPC